MTVVNDAPSCIVSKTTTVTDLVELWSEQSHEAVTLRSESPQLRETSVSGDSTGEDSLMASEVDMSCSKKLSNWEKENYDVRFKEVNGEASLVVVSLNNVLPMTREPTTTEHLITNLQDIQVSDDKWETESISSFITLDTEGGTVTDIEEFKSKPHEKTSKFGANELTVKGDSCRLLVHITWSEADSECHGLFCEVQSGLYTTDIEDQLTGSGVEIEPNIKETSPEISAIDGSSVKASSVMRVCKMCMHSEEPVTGTENLYLDCFPDCRDKKSAAKSRLMSLTGNKRPVIDVKYHEVSDTKHLTQHSALIFTSKHVDTNTDIEDRDISEGYHKKDTSIISDFVRHMDYDIVTVKEADGPFPPETRQAATSFGSPVVKMTPPGTEMYSGSTTYSEDIVRSADDEAILSCSHTETATPVDLELATEDNLLSTIHMKHTHEFNVDAPEETDHIKGGGDIEEILTNDETLQQHHPEDHICVVDVEDQVCVCVAAENVTHYTVCICMGKLHGELKMEWNASCTSAASHTGNWNATEEHEGMGCILQLSCTTSCLPANCIRADLSSRPVAVPHCHPTQPPISNLVTCSCLVRTLKRT
jgi:hypothetical protein